MYENTSRRISIQCHIILKFQAVFPSPVLSVTANMTYENVPQMAVLLALTRAAVSLLLRGFRQTRTDPMVKLARLQFSLKRVPVSGVVARSTIVGRSHRPASPEAAGQEAYLLTSIGAIYGQLPGLACLLATATHTYTHTRARASALFYCLLLPRIYSLLALSARSEARKSSPALPSKSSREGTRLVRGAYISGRRDGKRPHVSPLVHKKKNLLENENSKSSSSSSRR